MKPGLYVEDLAASINEYCEKFEYFWAYGLVRETINLWRVPKYHGWLCDTAQSMVYTAEIDLAEQAEKKAVQQAAWKKQQAEEKAAQKKAARRKAAA